MKDRKFRMSFFMRMMILAFIIIFMGTGGTVIFAEWVENATYNDGSYIWDIDYTNNRIGIGTQQPREKVSIYGTDNSSGIGFDTKLGIGVRADRRWTIMARHYDETSGWGCYPLIIDRSICNYSGNFVVKGDQHAFSITREGNVGIGIGIPTELLDVRGNIFSSGTITAQNYACSSDARYKKNISPCQNALEKVLGLRGVTYFWNAEKYKDRNFSKDKQIGFIAQEVEKVIPEVGYTDDKGFKTMSYDRLTAVLVEAVKELKVEKDEKDAALELKDKENEEKIAALEKENEALKRRLAKFESLADRLASLEKRMEKQEGCKLAER